ncbi:TraU family protein [Helicobacter sp. 13S00477-4]|uniref:TraU family protein n=1 Tax=Helicobacter sp. 13S00477-4 TaxID=1905759 RepID=UPI000BA60BCC|nr:TraU family protein [Helicobacter sp. 13S00477-4]PAF50649.1 hypothetical protein BKH44_07340 [Helicobacter sp. 13S00477-4]
MKKIMFICFLIVAFVYADQDYTGSSADDAKPTGDNVTTSKSPMLDFMNSLDWEFFGDKFEISLGDICMCDTTGDASELPVGLKASLVEPILGFSSSNETMNFMGLNVKIGGDALGKEGVSRSGTNTTVETTGFRQSNFFIFPMMALINFILPDAVCFDRSNTEISASYISETDPTYQSDILALATAEMNPLGRAFFKSPLADLACLADCVAATAGHPINSLYWCDGCRGNMGAGNTGYTKIGDPIENSEMIALRQLSVMHETMKLLKTSNASFSFLNRELPDSMCGDKIFPLLIKDQYYIQLAYGKAKRFGALRLHYDFQSEVKDKDAFFFWIWRKRDYCMGQTPCK